MIRWEHDPAASVGAQRTETTPAGAMVAARHRLPAGFDAAPHYRGFPDGACQAEHWCYLVRGKLRYRFTDGTLLRVDTGDAFHLRPGHVCVALEDSELIEFTSARDHALKRAHLSHAGAHAPPDLPFPAPRGPAFGHGGPDPDPGHGARSSEHRFGPTEASDAALDEPTPPPRPDAA